MNAKEITDRFRVRLEAQRGSFNTISRTAGISRTWIRGFLNKEINNPTVNMLEKLDQILNKLELRQERTEAGRPNGEASGS